MVESDSWGGGSRKKGGKETIKFVSRPNFLGNHSVPSSLVEERIVASSKNEFPPEILLPSEIFLSQRTNRLGWNQFPPRGNFFPFSNRFLGERGGSHVRVIDMRAGMGRSYRENRFAWKY